MSNFSMYAVKTGIFFEESAMAAVDEEVDSNLKFAQEYLLGAIRAKTPMRQGILRSTVVARGEMLKRSVVANSPYSVPVDQGYIPATVRRRAAGIKKGKKAKFMRAHKVAGQKFFYATYQALKMMISATYIAPIGGAIVRTFEGGGRRKGRGRKRVG